MPVYANPLASMMQGQMAAQGMDQMRTQNALSQLYKTQGQGIAAGDPNAVNALAQLDPMAAMDIRRMQAEEQRLTASGRRADAELSISQERLQLAKEATRVEAMRLAEAGRLAEVAAEAEETQRAVDALGRAYASGDAALYQQVAQGLGEDIAGIPMQDFPTFAAAAGASLEGMFEAIEANKPEGPKSTLGKLHADQTAGLVPEGTFEAQAAGDGMVIESTPGGGLRVVQGRGAATNADAFGPKSPASMIASIDGILEDPALGMATGVFAPLQNVPGTGARRVGSRIDQLGGQAFLQAFESLKGGGQITQIEGEKATQAIGRLDSYQSEADYRTALTELRDLLVLASERPEGWAQQRATQQATPETGVTEDGYRFLGGDPGDQANWEKVK